MRALLVAICLVPVVGGCALNYGDLNLVSPRNVEFSTETLRRGVEGRDCTYSLLFLPLGSLNPNIEEAVDRALAKVADANVLTDVAIYNDAVITLLFNRSCLRVKGDAGVLR